MDKQTAKQAARHGLVAVGLVAAIGIAVAAHPLPDGHIADTASGPAITSIDTGGAVEGVWEFLDRAHETGEVWREAGERREHDHTQNDILSEADKFHHDTRAEQTPDAAKGQWDI